MNRNKQINIMEKELKRKYFGNIKRPQKEPGGKRKVIFYRCGSRGGYYWWAPEEKE